jgi:hypothetical protein
MVLLICDDFRFIFLPLSLTHQSMPEQSARILIYNHHFSVNRPMDPKNLSLCVWIMREACVCPIVCPFLSSCWIFSLALVSVCLSPLHPNVLDFWKPCLVIFVFYYLISSTLIVPRWWFYMCLVWILSLQLNYTSLCYLIENRCVWRVKSLHFYG